MAEAKKPEPMASLFGNRPNFNFDKILDFKKANARKNPLLLRDFGRNIYQDGEKIGYALDVRIQGYRGLPINVIKSLCFEVNGVEIPDDCKEIWYEAHQVPYDDLGTEKLDLNWWWKYQDYIRVFFRIPDGIEQGIHHVKFGLALRDHYNTTAFCEKDVTIV